MLAVRSTIVDVPALEDAILTVRELNEFPRIFYFRNLTDSELTLQLQTSVDGVTWADSGSTFTVGAVASATEIVAKYITSTSMLRVQGSGGGDDKDLMIAYCMMYQDDNQEWSYPLA